MVTRFKQINNGLVQTLPGGGVGMRSLWVPLCCLVFALNLSPALVRASDAAADGSAAAATAGEHPAAKHSGGHGSGRTAAQIVDPDLALWTLFIFLGLSLVLGKFAWGPIVHALEDREKKIHEDIAAAKRQNEEARGLLGQYQAQLSQATEQVKAMLEEARRDAEYTKDQIVAEARKEATAEKNRALRDIGVATDEALKTMAEKSADLAVGLAGKILQRQLNPGEHQDLIRQAVTEFEAATPSKN